jgi:dipeptidyl-peptidase-3
MSRASWAGYPIVLEQVSPESWAIFQVVLHTFGASGDSQFAALKHQSQVSDKEFDLILSFCAQFLGNAGNFKSFGDTKFIPRVPADVFRKVVLASNSQAALKHYDACKDKLYSLEGGMMLGYPSEGGVSTYYSSNIKKEEIALVQKCLEAHHINAYNTRLFKEREGLFKLKIAAAETYHGDEISFDGGLIKVEYGDYHVHMGRVTQSLLQAVHFTSNEVQQKMLKKYAESFAKGSIEAHKESQRYLDLLHYTV